MDIILLGASNPETIRMIRALEKTTSNFRVVGFIDNDNNKKGKNFYGYPILGGFEILDQIQKNDVYFVNLITGSTAVRYETSLYLSKKGCKFTNLIHPSIDLTMVSIGSGNYIQEGVIIQAMVKIGDNSSIHIGSLIAHECTIGNSVFIAHGVSVSGLVRIDDGTFVGTHATILPRLTIGKWCTIGAGSVVIRDVPDYAVVVGNPAGIIRYNEIRYENGKIDEVI